MITTLVYRDTYFVQRNPPVETLVELRKEPGIMLWVDLSEPTDEETRQILEQCFAFHPLAIEDCVSDSPVPKVEDYDEYLYLVMHAVDYTRTEHFSTTEVDLFLGKNFLVTYHRKPLKPAQAAVERHARAGQQVRGPDRFAHTLLDQMVEAYKPALMDLEQDMEELVHDSLAVAPGRELFARVAGLRKEFSSLKQIVRPQREVAAELAQGKTKLIRQSMVPYLRDLAEDLARIEAQSDSWADELILSFRVCLNKSSHDAGAGIKVLTAITALTIPILTVGAWFGMNYKYMRELELVWTYPLVTVLMFAATFGMLAVMRKRRWM